MDLDSFLVAVYVAVDDWWLATHPPASRRPGRPPQLSPSEVLTLAVVGQWPCWPSEAAFWRCVEHRWQPAFPHLCSRSQFNRRVRALGSDLQALQRAMARPLLDPQAAYRVLDTTLIAVLHHARADHHGWFAGQASFGWCAAKGDWVYGFKVGVVVTADGVVTAFVLAGAADAERQVGEALIVLDGFACYLGDKGFSGTGWEAHWLAAYGARVVAPPRRSDRRAWDGMALRWSAGKRQIVEQAIGQLRDWFGLAATGAHTLSGLLARLAAKVTCMTCCQALNHALGRPLRHFADLVIA
jgi:DDE family transposase